MVARAGGVREEEGDVSCLYYGCLGFNMCVYVGDLSKVFGYIDTISRVIR